MKFGISTACFYPEKTETAVKYLCENNVADIEVFLNSESEMQGKIFKEYSEIIKQNGTNVLAIHPYTSSMEPFMLFSDYERRFEDALEYSKKYFELANKLGSQIVILHGDRKDRDYKDDRYIERYFKLYSLGREFGVYVAQENVERCRSRDKEFIRKMKNELGEHVRFVLDLKQARRSGVDCEELISIMGDKIIHTHLSDFDDEHDCMLISKGKCDFKRIFELLNKNGFDGSSVIELYRNNYNEYYELLESLEFLRKNVL